MDVVPMAALAGACLRAKEGFPNRMVLAVFVSHSSNKTELRPFHPDLLHHRHDSADFDHSGVSTIETLILTFELVRISPSTPFHGTHPNTSILNMRYHDFHLAGYSVTEYGNKIILDLLYEFPNQPRVTSRIKFSEIAVYHFVHTGGAIIIDIAEVPIRELLLSVGDELADWWRLQGGLIHWNDDLSKYITTLEQEGYHAWRIDSAVGFGGFVIAKSIGEAN
jgi:hypothetical protein